MSDLLEIPKATPTDQLPQLVEHQQSFPFDAFSVNLFETHQEAYGVELSLSGFVLTAMFKGKKVMKLNGHAPFDYLPGETVLVAPGEKMRIDFPEAQLGNPTQCLAVEISQDLIQQTLDLLNERWPKPEACGEWQIEKDFYHLLNNEQIVKTVNRLLHLSIHEEQPTKEALLNLTMRETLVRLMQTQAGALIRKRWYQLENTNPMAHVVAYMKTHISGKINMNDLAAKAGMSRAAFFKKFKELFGISPCKMLLQLRIDHARQLLRQRDINVTEAAYASGFENLSHFTRAFKQAVGVTPGHYQLLTLQ